jgi:hypothetical protein
MRKAPPILLIVLSAAALTTCAKGGPVVATAPPPATVTSQKWFSVDKHNPWWWGCLVRVTPTHGPATHLKVNMEVSWLLVNQCDDSADLELSFFRDGKPVDSPIEFEPIANGVLKGRVRDIRPSADGVRFKYSARSGRHRKDPEIVIFP